MSDFFVPLKDRPVERSNGRRFYIPPAERAALETAKMQHKRLLMKHYGKDWKKYLNVKPQN